MNFPPKEKSDYATPVRGRSTVRGPGNEDFQIVEVMENKDDEMYAPDWARRTMTFLPITAAAAIISAFVYWRLYVGQLLVLRARGENMNGRLLFAAIDLLVALSVAIKSMLDTIAILTPKKTRPFLRLNGSSAPMVDIIITTCNEDLDICLDTVRAVMNIDYPTSRMRVLVADDGASMDLKSSIEAMAEKDQARKLFYTTRVKGRDDRHKAGNLNHALRFFAKLPGGASPFVAGFDADMIPVREFLRASMPHHLKDHNLGFTCPAATYYNNATNDPLLQSQTVVNKFEECFRDRVNNAWNTGSGWVARRCALDELGGFPMRDIAEDVFCSSGIQNLGYNAAFLSESLQFGLVPDSYKGHLKQHRQWKLGGLQIGLHMKFGLFGEQCRGMTWNQRLYWFFYPFKALTSPLVTIGLMTSPLFMLVDIPWIVYVTPADLKLLTQASSVSFLCAFVLKCHIAVLTGFKASLMEACNDIWMAPYHTVTQLQSYVLPNWLGGRIFTFVPTGTVPNELNERSKARRAPLHHRLRSILLRDGALFQCLYTLCCFTAAGSVVRRAYAQYPSADSQDFYVYLLTHLGWLPLPWFFAAFACLTPLRYAIFPPDVPDREDLLDRDPVTGVAYPVMDARRVKWEFELIGFQNLYFVGAAYCLLLLYGTWAW